MSILQQSPPAGYGFGLNRADDGTPRALTYEPCGTPAPEPWTDEERREWAAAELSDYLAERGSR